ncbi:chaperone modulator CbpM [Albibacterium bauzanense]|uniref:MerR-like DNA binding protein n=1 Tax=Albibacterium bauzanense TaxID=653929 RepID=A0A4R1M295_9SPHI|nr:chaperone modulator CbpM [Albibacterium bauzanense]TCK85835.1 MerR-like DNA binding protein [Albibacterium bauzanense]
MDSSVIKITEYCSYYEIEPDFVISLEGVGLIETLIIEGERFIHEEQLKDLERYVIWHYDMDINIEGIDALRNMLANLEQLQSEVLHLKEKLRVYE